MHSEIQIHFEPSSVFQIRRGNGDNLGTFSLLLHKNIHCDPSFEQSCQDNSNEGGHNIRFS